MRETEVSQIAEALLSGQSLLVLGEPGAGKTSVGEAVRSQLEFKGYTVGMVKYSGSANDLLKELCEQFGVELVWMDEDTERSKNKTAAQLKADLLDVLKGKKTLLIADDAHRWSATLRYWLEDCWRAGALLLLLAWEPAPKDIFAKLPVTKLEPLKDDQVRDLLRQEAERQGVKLSLKELADLQGKAGNNPGVAKRVIREAALGLTEDASAQHYQYIDGTPMLLALIACVGVIRFVGLGLGDKSLYIIGGLLTLAAMAVRAMLYAANRGGKKL